MKSEKVIDTKRIPFAAVLEQENFNQISEVIKQNGIIVYPTDTLYGIGGNFFSIEAMEAVDGLKQRTNMPYSVAVADMEMLTPLVESIPPIFETLYRECLPGKFTFLFKASSSIDPILLKNSTKIGIRIPNIPVLLQLIKKINVPLVTTSVNRSGELPMNSADNIMNEFSLKSHPLGVPVVIDGGVLPVSGGSTILDLTVSPIKCLRKGDCFGQLEEMGIL